MPDDSIELDDHPELAEFVEGLAASGRPCRVTRHGKTVTLLASIPGNPETTEPVDIRGPGWRPDPTGLDRAAGGWAGIVDGDKLIEELYAARIAGTSNRPPVHFDLPD